MDLILCRKMIFQGLIVTRDKRLKESAINREKMWDLVVGLASNPFNYEQLYLG